LLQRVLATARREQTGRVAFMRQTLEMTEESGAVDGDNNGFVNMPFVAKEVVGSVYMREVHPETYRVSLRSKGPINVARVAETFGGGGHKNAAGFRVSGDWDEVEREIEKRMIEAIDSAQDADDVREIESEYTLA